MYMSIHKQLKKHRQLRNILIISYGLMGILSFITNSMDFFYVSILCINAYTFILVIRDKNLAQRKQAYRIPEKSFFFLALIGGSLGLYLSMAMFRHKTKHTSFTLGIPFIIFLQGLLFYFILLS